MKSSYNIGWFIYNHSPIYINTFNIFKPIQEWWKVRKIFKRPSVKFIFDNSEEFCYDFYFMYFPHRWLDINFREIQYKSFFDDTLFEETPAIYITFKIPFCKHKTMMWKFCSPTRKDDHYYWESILFYLYELPWKKKKYPDIYIKDTNPIVETYINNIWTSWTKDGKSDKYYIDDFLTKDALKIVLFRLLMSINNFKSEISHITSN